jgi:SAM-dependent methyltransferase
MKEEETYQLETAGAMFYEKNFVPVLFEKWATRIVEKLGLGESDRLLDIACGTGIVARKAKTQKIDKLKITGCDINTGMLKIAKQIDPEINWIRCAAEKLPFNDGSFEKISCQFGFMFFQDQVKSLQEMERVKKKNGKIIISIWDIIEANEGYFDLLQVIENICGENLGQTLKAPFRLGNISEIEKLLKRSEISNYNLETIQEGVEFLSIEHWIDCDVKASPIAEKISKEQYMELIDQAETSLYKYVGQDQKVRFRMSAHIVTIE